MLDAMGRGLKTRINDLSETFKLTMLVGQYMHERYHRRYYAKAQNLSRSLYAAYNAALQTCDILVMPMLPMKTTKIPASKASRGEIVHKAFEMLYNMCPFDATGHPAVNVPCGLSEGLPVGMMLVGRKGYDALLLLAAHAFEREVFSAPKP